MGWPSVILHVNRYSNCGFSSAFNHVCDLTPSFAKSLCSASTPLLFPPITWALAGKDDSHWTLCLKKIQRYTKIYIFKRPFLNLTCLPEKQDNIFKNYLFHQTFDTSQIVEKLPQSGKWNLSIRKGSPDGSDHRPI